MNDSTPDSGERETIADIFVVAPEKVALSVLGAVALNMVLAINHRAGRYMGVS